MKPMSREEAVKHGAELVEGWRWHCENGNFPALAGRIADELLAVQRETAERCARIAERRRGTGAEDVMVAIRREFKEVK
jgi:hypothetical protein